MYNLTVLLHIQQFKSVVKLPYSIPMFKVTGKCMNRDAGYGLDISVTYTCIRLKQVVMWIQKKISEEMKTTDNMKNKCSK